MLDAWLRRRIDPPLARLGLALAGRGVGADALTWAGFAAGVAAAGAVAFGAPGWAVLPFALNRLLDGLDGAVARVAGPSDRGGFLDITLDFLVYAAIPLGFAVADPDANALAAAVLLFTFVGTASTFLAYAVFAAKRGVSTERRGRKSFYFLGGLAEGGETAVVLLSMCAFPGAFVPLAYGFAALCAVTAAVRLHTGVVTFRDRGG
ncbi:MAG: CDP-alcohol phosphatidyltransferase family protein [Alphaproteobacteria bacterium]|nr:CDP-alcohol phosphatidyltransferase family protein [Alphaproteobacteria bacterium]